MKSVAPSRICSFILAGSIAAALACSPARAANQTWDGGSTVNGFWSTGSNWVGGSAPGTTSSTTNTDIALFNAGITNTWGNSVGNAIAIDLDRDIDDINFDAAAGNYFIGYTTGTTLGLSSGGSIQILSTLSATNAVETINAPLVVYATTGTYTFANNSANGNGAGAGTLDFGGLISSSSPGYTGTTAFTLSGSNTNANTISGVISDGSGGDVVSLTKTGNGTWVLAGANAYTGATTISAGQLIATNASALNPTGGGAVTVATGARLTYAAAADAPLGLHSTLAITGGTATSISGAIGSTATSAEIAVTGAATASSAIQVNLYGISGVAPSSGTYTLLAGGAGSTLNAASYSLGTVYNNSNFTVGAMSSTTTSLQVAVTSATPLTNAYWVGGLSSAPNVWSASNGNTASNWAATAGGAVQGLVPGVGTSVIISSTSPVTAPTATTLGANISIAGLTIADTVNGLGLNADGFALTIGAAGLTMNASVPTSTIGSNVVLGANETWTNNSANALTVGGVVSGNSSLLKAGTGTLILSGANTYTGATTINAGTLQLGSTSALGNTISAVTLANVAGATLNLNGFSNQIGSLTGGGATGGNISLGSATLTVGTDNTSPAAYAGVMSGTGGGLTKTGLGTLTLQGANTYTGGTTVNGGIFALSFGNVSANILPSASALTLGGGTFSLTGTGTQTVNGLTTTASTGNEILLGANTLGVTENLTLGALTGIGAGSEVNFNTAAGGANATTSTVGAGTIVITGQTAGHAINSSFTVTDAGGFGLATVNGSNQVVRLTTTALLPATGAGSGTDYRIDNNAGSTSTAGSSSLAVSISESAKSITVDTTTASGVVTLNSGVILSNDTWNFGGNGSNPWQVTGSASGAGLKPVTSGDAMNFNNNASGTVTLSSPILSNGSNAVNVYGTGTLVFAGANTYTGNTTIRGGTLQMASGGSISTSFGSVYVGYNAGDNAALTFNGGSVSNLNAYIGYSANSNGTVTLNSGTWTPTSALWVGYLGNGTLNIAGGTLTGNSGILIGANAGYTGAVTISSGSLTTNDLYISDGGTGLLNLTGGTLTTNSSVTVGEQATGTGIVTMSGGTWNASAPFVIGESSAGVLNLTGGTLTMNNTGLNNIILAQSPTSSGTLNIGTGGTAGTLNSPNVIAFSGSGTAIVNFNHTGSYTFAPVLAGPLSVNQLGTGTTILTATNTYTGATTVSGGTLAVNGSIASSSGVSVGQGATLAGHGSVSVVSGVGLVAPGGSEVLTGTQVDPSGGLSFAFSFAQTGSPTYGNASASGNDVIHLTGATPFVFTLTAANTVTVDFSGATLLPGQTYLGGFFTNTAVPDADVNQATFDYTGTNGAVVQYEGLVAVPSAAFATGTVTNGRVMEFKVAPEPVSAVSLMMGTGVLLGWRRRRPSV